MAESPFRHEEADDSPGFLLWKLTSSWQARITAVLGTFGLTQTQYAILASLRWFEERDVPPTQRDLVDHAQIDKMTLSKAIRRLEAQGLVARRPSPQDARATEVGLTREGRRTAGRAVVAVEDADDAFFSVLEGRSLGTWLEINRVLIAHHTRERADPKLL